MEQLTNRGNRKMINFLNLQNGKISVNTYRLANASATDLNDVITSHKNESDECLTASINNKLELLDTATGWVAVYTGLTGDDVFVFEEEGHNIDGSNEAERIQSAALIWDLDLESDLIVEVK